MSRTFILKHSYWWQFYRGFSDHCQIICPFQAFESFTSEFLLKMSVLYFYLRISWQIVIDARKRNSSFFFFVNCILCLFVFNINITSKWRHQFGKTAKTSNFDYLWAAENQKRDEGSTKFYWKKLWRQIVSLMAILPCFSRPVSITIPIDKTSVSRDWLTKVHNFFGGAEKRKIKKNTRDAPRLCQLYF